MKRRTLQSREQPEKLHAGLKTALVVDALPADEAAATAQSDQPVGVPHGVTGAKVFCRNLRIDRDGGAPEVYFCETHGYRVLHSSIQEGDGGPYPQHDRTKISSSGRLPADGLYDGVLRVSVNGSVHAHIEKLEPTPVS